MKKLADCCLPFQEWYRFVLFISRPLGRRSLQACRLQKGNPVLHDGKGNHSKTNALVKQWTF
jgi:hypothetical protein